MTLLNISATSVPLATYCVLKMNNQYLTLPQDNFRMRIPILVVYESFSSLLAKTLIVQRVILENLALRPFGISRPSLWRRRLNALFTARYSSDPSTLF